MATITIDDAELRELVRKHAQRAAAEYLTNRTIPSYPAYFVNNDWLVTYDWLLDTETRLRHEIEYLQAQIADLKKPWWRRWLHR